MPEMFLRGSSAILSQYLFKKKKKKSLEFEKELLVQRLYQGCSHWQYLLRQLGLLLISFQDPACYITQNISMKMDKIGR